MSTFDPVSLLKAWLHDPPSKALDVRKHEGRTREVLRALGLGDEASGAPAFAGDADAVSAALERLPLPTAGKDGRLAVGPEQGLRLVHPLSGRESPVDAGALRVEDELAAAKEIAGAAGPDARARFLLAWRFFPDLLGKKDSAWLGLPADTRQPDHTIWNHMDLAAAFEAAGLRTAFLSLSIGPVQSFIFASRTLRDLHAGSLLLSHLAFTGLVPVLEAVGPQSVLYPALRGVPAFDRWLTRAAPGAKRWVNPEDPEVRRRLLVPALPNRFVALVPAEGARELAERCDEAVRAEWSRIAGEVRGFLEDRWGSRWPGWDAVWEAQTRGFFDVRTAVLDRRKLQADPAARERLLGPRAAEVARAIQPMADAIPAADRYAFQKGQEPWGTWGLDHALLARVERAQREAAHFPASLEAAGEVATKCTMLGDLEQVGPAVFAEGADFWKAAAGTSQGGYRIRSGERLCAPALVKRFWLPVVALKEWRLRTEETRIADTATVAAATWLAAGDPIDPDAIRREHGAWSGQWLFDEEGSGKDGLAPDDEERAPPEVAKAIARRREVDDPPRYYAVLHMDGDELGLWLEGGKGPSVRKTLHPRLREYFDGLAGGNPSLGKVLDGRRHLAPTRHAALSAALLRFSLAVRAVVEDRHKGELVFAGGDDVIALLPLETALACAGELRDLYRSERDAGGHLLPGGEATISGGLAVAHHRSSLRAALQAARDAERAAKGAGRDALGLAFLRRSGEHARTVLPWTASGSGFAFAPELAALVADFRARKGDRWAYRLRADVPALGMLDDESFAKEMERLVARHDAAVRLDAGRVRRLLDAWMAEWRRRGRGADDGDRTRLREEFCVLVQGASFLARGRDDR